VADRVLMMENAYYSVISPEGCAAILWKDRKHAQDAALAMKPDAESIENLSVIDGIIPEPGDGAHADPAGAAELLKAGIVRSLDSLVSMETDQLLHARYDKFRAMGEFTDATAASEDAIEENAPAPVAESAETTSPEIDPLSGAAPSPSTA
ncbi:MAG: acetyl-CoA carboxylase carboxyl transferase subunit alpha, partial [Verrucomicrobiota bacterium]